MAWVLVPFLGARILGSAMQFGQARFTLGGVRGRAAWLSNVRSLQAESSAEDRTGAGDAPVAGRIRNPAMTKTPQSLPTTFCSGNMFMTCKYKRRGKVNDRGPDVPSESLVDDAAIMVFMAKSWSSNRHVQIFDSTFASYCAS